jgi:hypothetical protein
MAKEEAKKSDKAIVNPITEPVVNPTPKEGPIDITKRVKVKTTDKAPYHKPGLEIEVAPAVAEKMKANGWAK